MQLCSRAAVQLCSCVGSSNPSPQPFTYVVPAPLTHTQVIKALAVEGRGSSNRPALRVPYRDSNLTKLLSDSLGGNALTLMLACCSPLSKYAEESARTLQYACSAGAIRNRPAVKLDPQDRQVASSK